MNRTAILVQLALIVVGFALAVSAAIGYGTRLPYSMTLSPALEAHVSAQGKTRVMVRLAADFLNFDEPPERIHVQQRLIRSMQEEILTETRGLDGLEIIHLYDDAPLMILRIDSAALQRLQTLPDLIVRIEEQCSYFTPLCDEG